MLLRRILINYDSIFFGFLILIFIRLQSCRGRDFNFSVVCGKYNLNCIPHWQCPKDGGYIKNRSPVICGFDKGNVLMCCNPSYGFQTTTTTHPQKTTPQVTPTLQNPTRTWKLKNAIAIATRNCEKYANHRYVKEWLSPQLPGEKGTWYDTLQCDNEFDELPRGGEIVRPSKYPHMARIGYGDDFSQVKWNCDGSLISERFILSAAQCGKTSPWGTPRWIQLGTSSENFVSKGNKATVYEIVNTFDHPDYHAPLLHNDISLFELNTDVVMSAYIRPACLFPNDLPTLRRYATGFQQSDELIRTPVIVENDTTCSAAYYRNKYNNGIHRGYDTKTMMCTSDENGARFPCEGNFGGPLQMHVWKKMCMWNIVGVFSFGKVCSSVENGDLAFYTKVENYIVWIQNIVWPESI